MIPVSEAWRELDDLALKHGTDKSSQFHRYVEVYYQHFANIRHNVERVLEIGIAGGGSLRMWADFFPRAQIFGIDNSPTAWQSDHPRITTVHGDQSDVEFLDRFISQHGGQFDIVIDDAGHEMLPQLRCFLRLYPELVSRGIYVLEDLHTAYWTSAGGGPKRESSSIEYLKDLIDEVNMWGKVQFGDPARALTYIMETNICGVSYWEQTLRSIHFYKSLAFVYRR